MRPIQAYQDMFSAHLSSLSFDGKPAGLYNPMSYIMTLGGKRMRPVLVLMACEAMGKDPADALGAAAAVELFHNFTLLHDDIMDAATLRRGQQTVHHKWDVNTGILSGDALLVTAYQQLNKYDNTLFAQLTKDLSQTALLVCEGQQYDVDFETQENVSKDEYLHMIKLKTAVLLGCALRKGALVGGATAEESFCLYDLVSTSGLHSNCRTICSMLSEIRRPLAKKWVVKSLKTKKRFSIILHCHMQTPNKKMIFSISCRQLLKMSS